VSEVFFAAGGNRVLLFQACVELIAREKSVTDSPEWVKLRKENPDLAAELLEDALRKKFA
jgi:hypothetical protein